VKEEKEKGGRGERREGRKKEDLNYTLFF